MASNDVTLARTPLPTGEMTIKNTEASTAMVPGNVVKLDASHLLSGTQPVVGALLTTDDAAPLGVVLENIAVGATGRIAVYGIVPAIAEAAVTAGTYVQSASTGKCKVNAGAKPTLGLALTGTAADGDQILLLLGVAAQNS